MSIRDVIEAAARDDLDALVNLLRATDPATRISAAHSLGDLGDTATVEPLCRCLQANDPFLRNSALKALGKIGDASALPFIFDAATTDDSFRTRRTAPDALVRLGDERSVNVLSDLLLSPENPWPQSTRKWAAKLAVECRLTEAVCLLRLLKKGARPPAWWRLTRAIRVLERPV